ncbi:hypothetical protein FRC06_009404 [Ceratobasidium sp. 370]|nr:hypothetical protein FRC06_009404 [Ceratobasidium sp. 370]
MASCKVPEIDTNSLAASRTWRSNTGIPRRNFDSVTERLELWAKRAEANAKASAAAEIVANPFTGDDSPARTAPLDFFPPMLTGDSELDSVNYKEDTDTLQMSTKGKKELAAPCGDDSQTAKVYPVRAQANYAGITVDVNEHIVKPKYVSVPKDTSLNAQPSPHGTKWLLEQEHSSPRSSGPPTDDGHVQPANNRWAAPLNCPPLGRTDSQTILDGMRLEYPNYSTLREAMHPVTTASAPAKLSTPPRNPSPRRRMDSQTVLDGRRLMYPNHSIPHGPTHPTNTASTPTRSSSAASHGKAPSNPQSISRPQDPWADSGSTHQGSGHSLHPVSSTQSSSTSVRPAPPPTRPAPAARRDGPASATPRNRQGPTPPPQGAPNPADSHTSAQCNVAQNKEGHPMPPVEDEAGEPVGLGGEEGPPEASAFKKKQASRFQPAT